MEDLPPAPASTSPPTPPPPPLAPPAPLTPPIINSAKSNSSRKFPIFLLFIPLLILLLVGGIFAYRRFSAGPATKTITYWGLWESEAIMRPVLDQFEKTHPGIKVNYQLQSLREYRERLKTALSQGHGPDVYRIHASWVPMFRDNLSPVPETVYSTAAFESTFYPAVKDTLRLGNSYAAIPLEYEGLVMFVNDNLLTQAGLNVPQNWDELRTAAITMSKCDTPTGSCQPGNHVLISGAALGTTDNVDHWQDIISVLMLQNNVALNNPTGQPANDVITYYSNFSRLLGIWDSTLPSSTESFAQGNVGIYFGPSWRVFDIKAINPGLKFSLYPLPQLPVVENQGEKPVTWASFWVEGVNNRSPNAAASWELLKYLSSKEVMPQLYQQQVSSGRDFGEPYSRVDLAAQISSDPRVSPVLSQAVTARTWYLASATSDGPTGINTQLSDAFAKAINGLSPTTTLASDVSRILSQYGINATSSFAR